ncbi:anthranilate phosphoribosyltransferase [Methanocorpusculum labreanum Z]|uniref:Anthranilate phosphoribosyltransferase n=1 Tax=Methanocorpusculum labreanum (strain ATCC 43576 / DSM 4855 / Z) TaxID=410358 RepID=TRPD_METLZ|nr:anthranilate phosphoribosyltransferase [Methanocorpusculum labreanum]A2STA7.1 RecName: Full=Anthranilate phosphoribosyltransferase [Methanocorpusculum labreanum Z]ABN07563.1 anthranilate phosphoribosyltransferase [Methanocorpusculum labreanum Z]
MIAECIKKVASHSDLSVYEAKGAMQDIMSGNATDGQIGAFLTALVMKGETSSEIAAFASVMRENAVQITPKRNGMLVDTCGTGGDGKNTFNISTAAAFTAAGAGVTVVKHGNRGATSKCGSADVLEALGIKIDISPERVCEIIDENGIGFMFAQSHHPAMKYAGKVRKEIGIRSFFNLIGPLSNPAGADAQLLGVYDSPLTEKIAEVLNILGTKRAMVVHGDGYDEITTTGITQVSEVNDGQVRSYSLDPSSFGFQKADAASLFGGDSQYNAHIIRSVLSGDEGPRRDIVILNAAAAIYLGERAGSIADGIKYAEKSIDSGLALEKLENLILLSGGKNDS